LISVLQSGDNSDRVSQIRILPANEVAIGEWLEMANLADNQTANLASLRRSDRRWNIDVLDGPNMLHLGKRDRRLFGSLDSIGALQKLVVDFGESLGVQVRVFASDVEGDLLKHVYDTAGTTDGYLVDPGGLATVSQGWPHALIESRKPVVEVCFYNMVANSEDSMFGRTSIGRVMGLRQYSYVAALLGLVLALDDETFLHPEGSASETVRKDGTPYSFKLA
jgi:3-dehydroquinate dehydratase-2